MNKKIYNLFKEEKVVAVIRTNTYEEAKEISEAAIEGGIKIVEVTMSVPEAPALIKELKDKFKDICIGAGTVLTKAELDVCVENNADFVVSPCLDEEIVMYSNEKDMLMVPGLMTMSEVNKAYKLGLRFIKVFPGNVVGKQFIGAAKSIFKDINIMPTGGVNKDNINEWLEAGADCSGIGSDLNKIYSKQGAIGVSEYCNELVNIINELS